MSRVLITGCSTGIGRATAIELAHRGHEVIATARRPETLRALDVAERIALDVTDEASVNAAVSTAGHIDVPVNNAGVGLRGPIETVPLPDVRNMFEVNYFGPIRMMQAVLPHMRQHGGGVVVNVSSMTGHLAGPLSGFYSSTKRALEAVSEALHHEVAHFGIRVVIIEPDLVDTRFETLSHHHGDETPPYDEFRMKWEATAGKLLPGMAPSPPEFVADAIANAIDDERTPLHVQR